MRRSLAIALAIVFSSLLLLPAFTTSSEVNLPACCRKDGKHHCAMQVQSKTRAAGFSAIGAKCPYWPASTAVPYADTYEPGTAAAVFAGIVRHPAVTKQTQAGYRVSHFRARQKRGPPTFLS